MKNHKHVLLLMFLLTAVPACAFWPFGSSEPITPQVSIAMSVNGNMPIATLKTNLPDGTQVAFGMSKDDAAGTTIGERQGLVEVKNGVAVSQPFSNEGKPLPGGRYFFFVNGNDWKKQPESVQKAIKDFDLKASCFNESFGGILDFEEKPFTLPDIGKNDRSAWLALGGWRPGSKDEATYGHKVLAMYDELMKLKGTKQFRDHGLGAGSKNAVAWRKRLTSLAAEIDKKKLISISVMAATLDQLAVEYARHPDQENQYTNKWNTDFEEFKACLNAKD